MPTHPHNLKQKESNMSIAISDGIVITMAIINSMYSTRQVVPNCELLRPITIITGITCGQLRMI